MDLICPRCDGNGWIQRVKIVDLGIEINICDECEASWNEGEAITLANFKYLNQHLEKLEAENSKLEVLGYLQEKIIK